MGLDRVYVGPSETPKNAPQFATEATLFVELLCRLYVKSMFMASSVDTRLLVVTILCTTFVSVALRGLTEAKETILVESGRYGSKDRFMRKRLLVHSWRRRNFRLCKSTA